MKSAAQSPNRWEMVELASLRAVLETCPLQRQSTALPWSLCQAGQGQILPWVDSTHVDLKDPGGIQPGRLRLSSRIRPLACSAASRVTIPGP